MEQRTPQQGVDTRELRQNYALAIELARSGGFRVPPEGWTAAKVVAHLVANDELFLAVGEAVRRGERPEYDNSATLPDELLEQRVAEAGGMPGLIDRLEVSSARLLAHIESLTDAEAAARIRFHVIHDGHDLVDEVSSWGDIVAGQAGVHIPLHIGQLRALAAQK